MPYQLSSAHQSADVFRNYTSSARSSTIARTELRGLLQESLAEGTKRSSLLYLAAVGGGDYSFQARGLFDYIAKRMPDQDVALLNTRRFV